MFLKWCPCVHTNLNCDSKSSTTLQESANTLEVIGHNFNLEESEEKFLIYLINKVSSYKGTLDKYLAEKVKTGMSSNKGESRNITKLRSKLGEVLNNRLSPTID